MGQVKLVFMTKFKDEISESEIEDFIKAYEKLVDAVETMKSVQYGKDIGSANYQQGFTHVFQSTFVNAKAVSDFLVNPAHLAFLENQGGPKLDKFIVLDYYPIDYPR